MRTGLTVLLLLTATTIHAADEKLPPAERSPVDFTKQVQPLLKKHCAECHSGQKRKGGFSINTRRSILDGSEADIVVVVGNSAKSPLITRVADRDPETRMPPKGHAPLTAKQIGVLRGWIDQGMNWTDGFAFGQLHRQASLAPRRVVLPIVPGVKHPLDRLLDSQLKSNHVKKSSTISDHVFARRVWLDVVGLLPPVKELEEFVHDTRPDKHARLVDRLLNDRRSYADHWMTFWSDLLRNDFRGTGYIDGGRKQITGWLYKSLYDNKPYDRFVVELISSAKGAEGFIHGIKWRGTVNDSQRREMQAAQNIAQVFLGTNLKCASCHDSFVNHWKLKQSYAFASVFANQRLELHRCNKATGKFAKVEFLYPELGTIDAKAKLPARLRQLSEIVTGRKNGRFTRTIANRLWARFFGAGIVEPLDDMDQKPWNQDLLDWLAEDLAKHDYDVKRTIHLICTSRAYRLKSVGVSDPNEKRPAFAGPLVKRMSAEQFADAIFTVTNSWPKVTGAMQRRDGRGQGGQLAAVSQTLKLKPKAKPAAELRCVFLDNDELQKALGRPIREQVVTRRDSVATTLQFLELTNGRRLDALLKVGATHWLGKHGGDRDGLIQQLYLTTLCRKPTKEELKIAHGILGEKPTADSVQDLMWIVAMLPEFQLVR